MPPGRGLSRQRDESTFKGLRDTVNCEREAKSNWALRGRLLVESSTGVVGERPDCLRSHYHCLRSHCLFDGLELVQSSPMTCGWPVVAGTSEALGLGCGSVEKAWTRSQGIWTH